MTRFVDTISYVWHRLFHRSFYRPNHGEKICRRCLRRDRVPF
jgi:uncharacterized membrane protein